MPTHERVWPLSEKTGRQASLLARGFTSTSQDWQGGTCHYVRVCVEEARYVVPRASGPHTALTVIFKSCSQIRRYSTACGMYSTHPTVPCQACRWTASTLEKYRASHNPPASKAMARLDGSLLVAMVDGLPISATVHTACAGDARLPMHVYRRGHEATLCQSSLSDFSATLFLCLRQGRGTTTWNLIQNCLQYYVQPNFATP